MNYENVASMVSDSLSSLINNLLSSVDNNVFSVLDELVFLDASAISDKYFVYFFSKPFSLIALCKALLLAFLIYYIVAYFFSLFTCSNFQKPLSFIVKIFFSALLVNWSIEICEYILDFFFLLTNILKELGFSVFSVQMSFSLLYKEFSNIFFNSTYLPFQLFSFDGVLKSFLSFGFVNLLFTYSVRFIFVKILVLISPFACLSLALDQSTWIFKIWLKNLIGQLFTQLFICIVLLIMFSFSYLSNPIIIKLLYVASVVCLIRLSSFVKDFTSGFTSDVSSSLSSIKSLFL